MRKTFEVKWCHPVNGLVGAAHRIADENDVDVNIDQEVKKTGWFSKQYAYYVTFSGEEVGVRKSMQAMREAAEEFRAKVAFLRSRM